MIQSIVYYREEYSLPQPDDDSAQWLETQLIFKASLLIAPSQQQAAGLPAYKTVLDRGNKTSWHFVSWPSLKGRPIIGFWAVPCRNN